MGFRDILCDKFWGNFSIRELLLDTCLRTPNIIRDRFWDVLKMSIELRPRLADSSVERVCERERARATTSDGRRGASDCRRDNCSS